MVGLRSLNEIVRKRSEIGAGLGVAARMGVELVVATCIGGGIGYWADTRWDSMPWLTLVGVLMGNVAGIRNILRLSRQLGQRSDDED